jgi:hypothetical protein
MARVRVGLFPPVGQLDGTSVPLGATLARVPEAGIDHLCVGDHVSFFVGAGSDGLISAASLLGAQADLRSQDRRLRQPPGRGAKRSSLRARDQRHLFRDGRALRAGHHPHPRSQAP